MWKGLLALKPTGSELSASANMETLWEGIVVSLTIAMLASHVLHCFAASLRAHHMHKHGIGFGVLFTSLQMVPTR